MSVEEIKKMAEKISQKRLFIQLPAGLMTEAREIRKKMKDKILFFSAHPCFGACDIQENTARQVGAEAIINVGHSDMGVKTTLPVYFVEWRKKFPQIPKIKDLPQKIGLVTTVQYAHQLEEIKQKLQKKGHEVWIGEPGPASKYPGQVTGCDAQSAINVAKKVEGFVFIGSSNFHALKVGADTKKPLWMVSEDEEVRKIGKKDINQELRKRAARKANSLKHDNYGILVSTKLGQYHLKEAEKLKEKLEKQGKNVIIIVGNVLRSIEISNFRLDAYITTACPRQVEDSQAFMKPVYSLTDF